MKKTACCMIMASMIGLIGCKNYLEGNHNAQMLYAAFFSMSPILNPLAIAGVSNNFITLAQPVFAVAGSPVPTVEAYIGLDDGSMTISGSTVGGAIIEGPVDVSAGPYQFLLLSPDTTYRIYVVAMNTNGYSVRYIVQSTSYIAPVLNALSISTTTPVDSASITIDQPSFSTAGNPAPTVYAYIGEAGGATPITVTGGTAGYTVANDIPAQSGQDVSVSGCSFTSLGANTLYRIYVVADNVDVDGIHHQSIVSIDQSTTGIAPILDAATFAIDSFGDDFITIETPGFSQAGNPTTSPVAYIGLTGNITSSVSGATATVSGYVDGPIVLAGGPGALYTFNGLYPDTAYTVVVVAENGISPASPVITSASTTTTGTAPDLNPIAVAAGTDPYTDITLSLPTFVAGFEGVPAPTVSAYIGQNGIITIELSTGVVSGALQGPIDVSTAGHMFSSLTAGTNYRIYVVARNCMGFDYDDATASTTGDVPVLNPISIALGADPQQEIQVDPPACSGNPAPSVVAYIGPSGVISESGGVVSYYIDGPYDVSSIAHTFAGLNAGSQYTVIVVARNSVGTDSESASLTTNP